MVENDMVGLITILAEQTGETLSKARFGFMVRKLAELDGVAVCAALERLVYKARRFPTLEEIHLEMGVVQSDGDAGREVGERIYAAISKVGSVVGTGPVAAKKWAALEAYVGPIGMEVIGMQGGWNHICEYTMEDQAPTLKAQWRELAGVLIRRGRSGGGAPQLPPTPGRHLELVHSLADKFAIK